MVGSVLYHPKHRHTVPLRKLSQDAVDIPLWRPLGLIEIDTW